MQPCNAPQNPIDAQAGRAINQNIPATFRPITDDDKQTAQEKRQSLIANIRREIDPLNNED
jgi:hypothetical protein